MIYLISLWHNLKRNWLTNKNQIAKFTLKKYQGQIISTNMIQKTQKQTNKRVYLQSEHQNMTSGKCWVVFFFFFYNIEYKQDLCNLFANFIRRVFSNSLSIYISVKKHNFKVLHENRQWEILWCRKNSWILWWSCYTKTSTYPQWQVAVLRLLYMA